MPRLLLIIASTRPGRVGLPVGNWFQGRAVADGRFEVEVADLATLDLPFLDEPHHPRLRQYVHEHTKSWSRRVDAADAVVFVMPEYNYSFNAPLKNAIDYLVQEWAYKPAGFVSYGGVSAGTRAVEALVPTVACLKMMALPEAVSIPFVRQCIGEDGALQANDAMDAAATGLLGELYRTAVALRPLREVG